MTILGYESFSALTGLPFPVKPGDCISTHGGGGYVQGSYVRHDGKVVFGACGAILTPCPGSIGEWMPKIGKDSEDDETV